MDWATVSESAPGANTSSKGRQLEKGLGARQRHVLALSREKLPAEIRSLPGFERFLLPKTVKQLSSLVHLGQVIFLNTSESHVKCDALVVIAGSEQVIHVPLLNIDYSELAGMQ